MDKLASSENKKQNYSNSASGGLSQFHPNVAKRIVQFYSKKGDWILDPFAGRVRAMISKMFNRNYCGFEISKSAYTDLSKRINQQKTLLETGKTILINTDSRRMNFENKFDMLFSCPPYWNVEDYNKLYKENITGQLSDLKYYGNFLEAYQKIINNCYRALKYGSFAVWVINDFVRDGKFILFHKDTIDCFLKAGFKMHDIIIRHSKTNVAIKIDISIEHKRMVKEHEFILVFKKV